MRKDGNVVVGQDTLVGKLKSWPRRYRWWPGKGGIVWARVAVKRGARGPNVRRKENSLDREMEGGCYLLMGGGVGDRSMTSSRKPTQPDGGNGCYPRVRRKTSPGGEIRRERRDPGTVALSGRVWSEACRRWDVVWAGSAEAGARRLFG